jgi:predicted ATPase
MYLCITGVQQQVISGQDYSSDEEIQTEEDEESDFDDEDDDEDEDGEEASDNEDDDDLQSEDEKEEAGDQGGGEDEDDDEDEDDEEELSTSTVKCMPASVLKKLHELIKSSERYHCRLVKATLNPERITLSHPVVASKFSQPPMQQQSESSSSVPSPPIRLTEEELATSAALSHSIPFAPQSATLPSGQLPSPQGTAVIQPAEPAAGVPAVLLDLDRDITVVIGPNDAGKSMLFRSLLESARNSRPAACKEDSGLFSSVEVGLPTSIESFQLFVQHYILRDDQPDALARMLRSPDIRLDSWEVIQEDLSNADRFQQTWAAVTAFAGIVDLSVCERLALSHGLRRSADNSRGWLNEIIRTSLKHGCYELLVEVFPMLKNKLSDSLRLKQLGDGLRSVAVTLTALQQTDRPILFIDEPELFLHPPQEFALGLILSREAKKNRRQLFIATHSNNLLRGCMEAQSVQVLRLQRVAPERSDIRVLSRSELNSMVKDPLMASSRVIDGLYFDAVLVLEGDTDVRFYTALLHKYAPNVSVHLVSVNGKATVVKTMAFYRACGVRTAGLVDFDAYHNTVMPKLQQLEAVLRDNPFPERSVVDSAFQAYREFSQTIKPQPNAQLDKQLEDLFNSLSLTEEQNTQVSAFREKKTKQSWAKELKQHGKRAIESCNDELKNSFGVLERYFQHHGVFPNPCGEIESLFDDIRYQVFCTRLKPDLANSVSEAATMRPPPTGKPLNKKQRKENNTIEQQAAASAAASAAYEVVEEHGTRKARWTAAALEQLVKIDIDKLNGSDKRRVLELPCFRYISRALEHCGIPVQQSALAGSEKQGSATSKKRKLPSE